MTYDEITAVHNLVRHYLGQQSGIQRHHAMHNLAQIAQVIAPENWSEQLRDWNETYILPPLSPEEIDRIILAVMRRTLS